MARLQLGMMVLNLSRYGVLLAQRKARCLISKITTNSKANSNKADTNSHSNSQDTETNPNRDINNHNNKTTVKTEANLTAPSGAIGKE